MQQKNAIALHGHVVLPLVPADLPLAVSANTIALNMEAATFGYTLSPTAGLALSALDDAAFHSTRLSIITGLASVTGSEENFNVLFAQFPYSTPDQKRYLVERVRGNLRRTGGFDGYVSDTGRRLVPHVVFNSGGTVLLSDGSAFNTADFGVDPVTQFALPGVRADENVRAGHARLAPLKVLEAASADMATAWVDGYFLRGSSLSAQEREFIEEVRDIVHPSKPERVFRETLPIVHSFHVKDRDYIQSLVSSATDVLRIAVFLSDPKADLSLAEPTKFHLSTSARKELLRLLDGMVAPEEDMLRRRERWLRLGERLNPGTAANRQRYPVAASAFDMLRGDPRAIPSFNRTFEAGMTASATEDDRKKAFAAVVSRPGEAIRRMEWMLRRTGEDALPFIEQVVQRAAPRMMAKLSVYLDKRIEDTAAGVNASTRAFPIKGTSNRFKVIADNRSALPVELLKSVQESIEREMTARLSALPPLGRVYVDPELAHRVVPVNRRGDSSASTRLDMGSAYPMDEAPVLRLFAWWKGDFDLDLSVNIYDKDWDLLQSIGFYNSHDMQRTIVHSGDIQNAPEGAAEFVDIDKVQLVNKYPTARYAVMSVISYRGDKFDTFPAFCGFMGRDALRSGRRFEPTEVLLRFDLTAPATSVAAAAWDITENRFIPVDAAIGQQTYSNALDTSNSITSITRHVVEMRARGLSLYGVAMRHILARGELVSNPADADLVLDIGSFGVEQAEAWLDLAVAA